MEQRFTERAVVGVDLAVSALSAYAQFECVGGKLTISDAVPLQYGSAAITSARLFDKNNQAHPYELIIFDQDPSATTFTDNAAITVNDADLSKICGVISFPTSSRASFADNSVTSVDGLYVPVRPAVGTTTFYAALRTGSASTPTFAATGDVRLELVLEW